MTRIEKDTRWKITVALMMVVIILFANTPLGMIQLPIIKATTVHIPVIIGAIVLGPMAGAVLGATFGVCSLISNTIEPTLMSFAFSPVLSDSGFAGCVKAVWISVGCRVLIGVVAGWIWIWFKKSCINSLVGLALAGFISSMTNTLLVMGSIFLLFSKQYAETVGVAETEVLGPVMETVATSGIPEAIAAAVLVMILGTIMLKLYNASK